MKLLSIALILFIGMASCHHNKGVTAPPVEAVYIENDTDVVMDFQRTPCFGSCPVYQATLYANGLLVYNGRRFAFKLGCFKCMVPKTEIVKVRGWFKDADIFNLKDKYPDEDIAPVDIPSCEIVYKEGRKEKKISDKNWNSPATLTTLEQKIDTWISIQDLQSCDK